MSNRLAHSTIAPLYLALAVAGYLQPGVPMHLTALFGLGGTLPLFLGSHERRLAGAVAPTRRDVEAYE